MRTIAPNWRIATASHMTQKRNQDDNDARTCRRIGDLFFAFDSSWSGLSDVIVDSVLQQTRIFVEDRCGLFIHAL